MTFHILHCTVTKRWTPPCVILESRDPKRHLPGPSLHLRLRQESERAALGNNQYSSIHSAPKTCCLLPILLTLSAEDDPLHIRCRVAAMHPEFSQTRRHSIPAGYSWCNSMFGGETDGQLATQRSLIQTQEHLWPWEYLVGTLLCFSQPGRGREFQETESNLGGVLSFPRRTAAWPAGGNG